MERIIVLYKNIIGLDIAVCNAHLMEIFKGTEKLSSHDLDSFFIEFQAIVHEVAKIFMGHIIHD